MSVAASLMLAWTGVYAFVCIFYTVLYRQRPEREYPRFAGLCAALGLYNFASALAYDAYDIAEATTYQNVQLVSVCIGSAVFVDLIVELLDESHPQLIRTLYTGTLAGVLFGTAGAFIDPTLPSQNYHWATTYNAHPPTPQLTFIGAAFLLWAAVGPVACCLRLALIARQRPALRSAALACGLGALSIVAQLTIRILDLSIPPLLPHGSLFFLIGATTIVIERFSSVNTALAERTGELATSYGHLREAQAGIVRTEQLAAVGELSAIIAHEVRNPLAIIKNAVSGLRKDALTEDSMDMLLMILDDETDRLNHLVNDLLAYAKPILPSAEWLNFDELANEAIHAAVAGSDEGHIEVSVELDPHTGFVQGDRTLLRHALINICENAMQAMPDGGCLTITSRETEVSGRPGIAIDVHDTGEGMDTMIRTRAREPFFTTRRTGTGLGLAIVDRVARVHGGQLELQSRHREGTTVSFVLPREAPQAQPQALTDTSLV